MYCSVLLSLIQYGVTQYTTLQLPATVGTSFSDMLERAASIIVPVSILPSP